MQFLAPRTRPTRRLWCHTMERFYS